jgi:membrane-associated phospholipid phosphatase
MRSAPWFGHLARLVVLAAMWAGWYSIYTRLNALGLARGVTWEAPGLFVPAAVYPYVFGSLALVVWPLFYNWRAEKFRKLAAAYALAMALSLLIYWLYPVVMERMGYDGPGLARRLMRLVAAADAPANCFPSSHCLFAGLGFIFCWAGGAGRWTILGSLALAVMVCLSTVLVGQHYWADVAGGIALAVVSYLAVEAGFRFRTKRRSR